MNHKLMYLLHFLITLGALQGSFAEAGADRVTKPTSVTEQGPCEQSLKVQGWLSAYPALPEYYRKSLSLQTPHSDHPTLSVIVPAYREAQRIGVSIAQIKAFFDTFPFNVEILVRIEKSPDNTVEVAREAIGGDPRFVLSAHNVQRGKGYAVRQGMLAARGDYVLFMDTDLSTPLPEIYHFLSLVAEGSGRDVMIGDRYDSQLSTVADKAIHRRAMSAIFQSAIGTVLRTYGLNGIHDTQCGFKMFTRHAVDELFPRATVNGFAFDIELLLMAARLGLPIQQIPVQWKDDARSTVNPFIDPIKMLWDVQKMNRQVRRSLGG